MAGTIPDYILTHGAYMIVLAIFLLVIAVCCVVSVVISVFRRKHPHLKALLPLFLLFLAWFLDGLVLILSADGWEGLAGLFTTIYSQGRLFALEMAVLAIIILALLYAIIKALYLQLKEYNWQTIWESVVKLTNEFINQSRKLIMWSGTQLKNWKVRMALLGLTLFLARAGFVRLLDPYPYDFISTEFLSFPALFFALISNGRFFVFVLGTALVIAISLIFSGLMLWWNFLKLRTRYTWQHIGADGYIAKTERAKRKRGILIWFASLVLFLLTSAIPVPSDTTSAILRNLQYITGNIALITHLVLTALVYIFNWLIARFKSPPNPPLVRRGPIIPVGKFTGIQWRTVLLVTLGIILFLVIWFVFVRNSQIVQNLANLSTYELGFLRIFDTLWPTIVRGVAIISVMIIVGSAILFVIWFVTTLVRMAKIIITKVGMSAESYDGSKILWLLGKPFTLLFSALTGLLEIAQSLVMSAIHVIIGPRSETSKNNMLYAAAGIASIVSFFNAFLSIQDFFITDDYLVVVRTIITVTLSLAIQIAVLVFGIKAGEALKEMAHLYRLERKAEDHKASKNISLLLNRLAKYLFRFGPYLLFMTFSVYFAFTTMFSAYANRANLRQITYYEVVRETERLLGINERIAAMEDEFDTNRTIMINAIDNDVANLSVLRALLSNHFREEAERRRSIYILARGDEAVPRTEDWEVRRTEYWEATGNRDRFINNTRELETTVDLIKNLIDMDFADVGRVTLFLEYYNHHWVHDSGAISTTYSYRSRSIRFSLPVVGYQNVGRRYTLPVPTQISHAGMLVDVQRPESSADFDSTHFRSGNERFVAVRTSRTLPNVDKYGLILHLYNYYIELRNLIESEANQIVDAITMVGAENGTTITEIADAEHEVDNGTTITEVTDDEHILHDGITDIQNILISLGRSEELTLSFRNTISRNTLIDVLRDEVEQLYHERRVFAAEMRRIARYNNDSGFSLENGHLISNNLGNVGNAAITYTTQRNTNISVRNLTRVASGTLRNLVYPRVPSDDLAFENLYFYVETSIELFAILSRLEFTRNIAPDHTAHGYPEFVAYMALSNNANEYQGLVANAMPDHNTNGHPPVFEVRLLRAYAQTLASSDFYLSLDVFRRGGWGLNNTDLDAIYSARAIAIMFFLFALSKDLIPFAVGLLIHKDIYTVKTNKPENLAKMGLFVLDDKLSALFEAPKCVKLRRLHGLYIAYLLYGEAAVNEEEKNERDCYKVIKELQLQAVDINLSCLKDKAQLTSWLDVHVKRDNNLSALMKELYRTD